MSELETSTHFQIDLMKTEQGPEKGRIDVLGELPICNLAEKTPELRMKIRVR